MSGRAAALAMALGGVGMGVLALLPWFGADLPDGRQEAGGTEASGELWSLPALGAIVVLAAVVLALAGNVATARGVGLLGLAAGALGVFWALRVALDPPVEVAFIDPASQQRSEIAIGYAPVDVLPAAWVAVAACCMVALAGLAALAGRAR